MYDIDFLTKLDKANLRTQYARISLYSFNEEFEGDIQGRISSGSLSVNGSSAVRRTINLTMIADKDSSGIADIENEISAKKKIKVFIGYDNPFREECPDPIIWFPCGMFVISTANISRSTSGWSITITGKDKMCMLDGTVGGVLPASITFHEKVIELENGDMKIEYPTIFLIIYEAVNHWGGEPVENIIISDLENTAKLLVKYMGDDPVYFDTEYRSIDFTPSDIYHIPVLYGEDAGYKETDFTWPGELILGPGDTVVTLLDKIKSTLGNYEYFYDIDGKFHFLQIKNYLNTGSPLLELTQDPVTKEWKSKELTTEDYVRSYNNAKYLYSLTDLDTTTSISVSPKYDLLKNDFYVWGLRKTSSDVEVAIRYHLVIDKKPTVFNYANKYMWEIKEETIEDEKPKFIIRYVTTTSSTPPAAAGTQAVLVGPPCKEWREELYRRALVCLVSNSEENLYYESELLAEWRNIYDPVPRLDAKINPHDWTKNNNWNPDVLNNPGAINFWLDFIDDGSPVTKYSIDNIGRRTKVVNDTNIKSIYNKEVPDIIFLDGWQKDEIKRYKAMGLRYFILPLDLYDLFISSSTGVSCFDKIREMLYLNLSYNTTITINCLPKYYMEPNNIIYVNDPKSHINGNYLITQFTLPLAYNGTMSITATEVLTRV